MQRIQSSKPNSSWPGSEIYVPAVLFALSRSSLLTQAAGASADKDCGMRLDAHSESVYSDILAILNAFELKDGFHHFLIGCIHMKLGSRDKALETLLTSVEMYPCNWSAWIELGSLIERLEQLENVLSKIPEGFMSTCFKIHVLNELCQAPDLVLALLDTLEASCTSTFISLQRALLYHNIRDFDQAQVLFEEIRKNNPYLLDSMDIYSNVLYVKEEHAALCLLAQQANEVDPYRPETCTILGIIILKKRKLLQSKGRERKGNREFWTCITIRSTVRRGIYIDGSRICRTKPTAGSRASISPVGRDQSS